MLENDLFIERFFSNHADRITTGQAQGLLVLMDLADNDLLDLLLGRKQLEGELLQTEVVEVLRQMRMPAQSPARTAAS